jgi:hypothetical protein
MNEPKEDEAGPTPADLLSFPVATRLGMLQTVQQIALRTVHRRTKARAGSSIS